MCSFLRSSGWGHCWSLRTAQLRFCCSASRYREHHADIHLSLRITVLCLTYHCETISSPLPLHRNSGLLAKLRVRRRLSGYKYAPWPGTKCFVARWPVQLQHEWSPISIVKYKRRDRQPGWAKPPWIFCRLSWARQLPSRGFCRLRRKRAPHGTRF